MKGQGTRVTPITAGVRTDLESLLTKFVDEQTVRFESFANCFKEAKLSLIFSGRATEGEFREFAEKTLVLALSFCFEPYSFQCRFGGLYLTYAMYYTQPAKYHSKIRITSDQWVQLLMFVDTLKEQQHFDACYVFYKLARDSAFYFCGFSEEHNPLNYRRYDNRHDTDRVVDILKSERPVIQSISEGPLIEQLGIIHENYYKLKCELAGDVSGEPDPNLSLIVESPVDVVKGLVDECLDRMEHPRMVKQHGRFGQKKRKRRRTSGDSDEEPANRRREIKRKAYASLAVPHRGRRNRQVVGENDAEPGPSGAPSLARTTSDSSVGSSPNRKKKKRSKALSASPGTSGVKGRTSQSRLRARKAKEDVSYNEPAFDLDEELAAAAEPSTEDMDDVDRARRASARQESQGSASDRDPVVEALDEDVQNIEASIQSIVAGANEPVPKRPAGRPKKFPGVTSPDRPRRTSGRSPKGKGSAVAHKSPRPKAPRAKAKSKKTSRPNRPVPSEKAEAEPSTSRG